MNKCEQDIEITEAEEKDFPVIAMQVLKEFPYTKMTETKLARRASDKNIFLYKVLRNKSLAAFIDFEVLEKGLGRITAVVVLEKFRGKSLGKILLSFALSELKKFGCVKVILIVSEDNEKALRLYTFFDFVKIKNSERKISDYAVFEMQLNLIP